MEWSWSRRLSPALLISVLALFIALGGIGYAAFKLPKNSVGSKQLKNGSVTSNKVKDGSLLGKDFKAGQLPAGPAGPAGPQGPAGPSTAYAAFHDEAISLTSTSEASPQTVATLGGLPVGAYAVQAKLIADSESTEEDYTRCNLVAEGDNDYADDYLGHQVAGDSFRAVFAMQLVHTFAGPGTVTVSCRHNLGVSAFVKEIKITAIKLGSIGANTGV